MAKFFCVAVSIALAPTWSAESGELREVNAGIIAYACLDNGAHYLLAFDPHPGRRGWGAFGGRPQVGELARDTAVREFNEETNCAFQNQLGLLQLDGPSGSKGYFTYFAEVPFQRSETIAEPRQCEDVERRDWLWVAHDGLINALTADVAVKIAVTNPLHEPIHLWHGAERSLRQARRDELLPESDPCEAKGRH